MLAHALFWQRYFYKIHRLAKDEALRNTLMERTEKLEHDTQWDEEGSYWLCWHVTVDLIRWC